MATEIQKPKERDTSEELPEKTLEVAPNKPSSLADRLDKSPNPSTLSSLQPSAGDPVATDGSPKEVDSSKETEPLSTGDPLSTPAAADAIGSDLERKIRRAERFGMSVQLSEEEKRSSRAERFGTAPTLHGSDKLKESEDQKRKARAERFGLPIPVQADEEAKKKARLARFAPVVKKDSLEVLVVKKDSLEEDKKKARAIRFSQTPSSAPQVNGKGSSELLVEGPEH